MTLLLQNNDRMVRLLNVRVIYTQVGPNGPKAYMGQNIHLHYSNTPLQTKGGCEITDSDTFSLKT